MNVAPKTASRPQLPNRRAGSESRAENIVITVTPEYRPEHSNPADERYIYAYRVVVENTNSYPVKLIARRWEIIDSEGNVERVQGKGVVGEMPKLRPGEVYTYLGFCPLRNSFGTVEGAFTFTGKTRQDFEVKVNRFYLVADRLEE